MSELRTIFITALASPALDGSIEWVEAPAEDLPALHAKGWPVISVVVPIKPFRGDSEWLNHYINQEAT